VLLGALCGVAAGIGVGLLVADHFAPLVSAFFVLGLSLGLVWEGRIGSNLAHSPNNGSNHKRVRPSLAFVAFAIVGVVWSIALRPLAQSATLTILAVGLSPFALGPLFSMASGVKTSRKEQAFIGICMATGPALLYAIAFSLGKNAA
jgi:archaellum biogenesis protein FlaJ (TadC family)